MCYFETWDETEQCEFDGVMVGYMDDDLIVPDTVFYSYLTEACKRYSEINNDKEVLLLMKKAKELQSG
jgi:hypothetical protein